MKLIKDKGKKTITTCVLSSHVIGGRLCTSKFKVSMGGATKHVYVVLVACIQANDLKRAFQQMRTCSILLPVIPEHSALTSLCDPSKCSPDLQVATQPVIIGTSMFWEVDNKGGLHRSVACTEGAVETECELIPPAFTNIGL